MCVTAESPTGQISYFMGELLLLETSDSRRLLQGKMDGEGRNILHGHVTAISVAPGYRRLKLAKRPDG